MTRAQKIASVALGFLVSAGACYIVSECLASQYRNQALVLFVLGNAGVWPYLLGKRSEIRRASLVVGLIAFGGLLIMAAVGVASILQRP